MSRLRNYHNGEIKREYLPYQFAAKSGKVADEVKLLNYSNLKENLIASNIERKKESIFNVHEATNSLWDRLFFHLTFVFGPFPVKFYNNRSQLLNTLFAE
jgi:hypothetical protein